ncbi:U3 small nucleolar RNA-associated protein 18 homolog [Chelonus insularis]|uniref:U3 small nucleolar RNA-associated protein 18 homolog n=1 Tax=Chelonus insularis TaxID=460826 RepID=UPI00158B569A|nr:U3 small nucleolar RNA-associated protein 18 homolog [Chelonus insularis]
MSEPKAKKQKIKYDPVEEARLEREVFGDAKDVIEKLMKKDSVEENTENNLQAFSDSSDEDKDDGESDEKVLSDDDDDEIKTEPEEEEEDDRKSSDSDSNSVNIEELDEEELKDAWVDDDDEKYSIKKALKLQNRRLPKGRTEKNYKELLENKFKQLVGTPKWAQIKEDSTEDDEDEILRHSNHLASNKTKTLPGKLIDLKVLKDVNVNTRNEGSVITSVQFHPTSTVALVAGLSGVLSICQIDGKENPKLQSIKFENFRINSAKFLKDGTEVLAGSRTKSYSQCYDLMTGRTYKIPLPDVITNMENFEVSPDGKKIAVLGRKWGEVFLLTTSGKELIHTFKMHHKCNAVAFTPDNKHLITHGNSEEIYIWDLNDRRCVHKAIDDGCITNGAVAISPSSQFLATGSKQGVVNIYETESVFSQRVPQPCKIVKNLVTPITAMKFNSTSEILAIASNLTENAFRMVHFPSLNVFSNFPTSHTVMNHPLTIDFSPGSGFMSVTNDKNNAFLYRLKHYGNY